MKTVKDILQEHIGKNVIFDIEGNMIINGKLNANQIIDAMEDYARQQVKNICDLAGVVLQSEQLPCVSCKPMEYYKNGIRCFKCRKCGTPMT